jgi:acyl-CoA synthetase (AMP-forming)/AMP-acid ligase II
MLDPFSLVPLAIAAHGGRVDEFEAQQLVAAGLTLLQRSAPLVRALSGKRSAILLPVSPQFFVALAASEGRGVLLIDPSSAPADIAYQLADANVGAVFTSAALAPRVPTHLVRALLDDAPRRARVLTADGARDVDLGSHHGLDLEGDPDSPGSDEEAIVVYSPDRTSFTHRDLLSGTRTLDGVSAWIARLLAGERVTTRS